MTCAFLIFDLRLPAHRQTTVLAVACSDQKSQI
jgi:hypothetical protein